MPSRTNLQRDRNRPGRHQPAVGHRFVEPIGVRRHAVLEIEQRIGVAGRSRPCGVAVRPTSRQSKYSKIARYLLIDRAVRLIDDDQVEMARTEACLTLLLARRSGSSSSDRSRDTRDLRWCCSVTRLTGAASGRCALKAPAAWFTSAIRSARNSTRLTQSARIKQIDQRDHRARLAGARRHHQQRLALAVLLETPRDAAGSRGAGRGARRSCGRSLPSPAFPGRCGAGSASSSSSRL